MGNDFDLNSFVGDEETLQDAAEQIVAEEGVEVEEGETFAEATARKIRQTVDVLRRELQKEGRTLEEAKQVIENNQLTEEEVTSGAWVKLADVSKWCKHEGIQVSRLVRATGGDRAMHAPLHDRYTVRWVGRVRYLPSSAISQESAEFLQAMQTERKPKAQPEATEDDEPGEGDIAQLTKAQLLKLAKDSGIENASGKMSKNQLINLLQQEGIIADE